MITFDSFTLVPKYSNIKSRSEIDLSTTITGIKTSVPIINANMHSICTPELCQKLSDQYDTFSSYHRFFKDDLIDNIKEISDKISNKNLFFPSIGVQKNDYKKVAQLYSLGFRNVIIDVNHGHHSMVKDMIKFIKSFNSEPFEKMNIMAGNVSSNDGIRFLKDSGADIVKIGNSFGFSCTTIKVTGFGVHPIHVAKTYREKTGDWDICLCVDGGIRNVADIAKSLIWGDIVMIGRMFAGCDESNGKRKEEILQDKTLQFKTYWGNASVATKSQTDTHIKYIEGTEVMVPYTGPIENTMNSIIEGLQSAFSFVGARELNEYQRATANSVLFKV